MRYGAIEYAASAAAKAMSPGTTGFGKTFGTVDTNEISRRRVAAGRRLVVHVRFTRRMAAATRSSSHRGGGGGDPPTSMLMGTCSVCDAEATWATRSSGGW